jgi:hypothetical protein
MNLDHLTFPLVQISVDLTSLDEALETAAIAVDAGMDWLEAGTPFDGWREAFEPMHEGRVIKSVLIP